jgi:osmoprotectant transport system permease protein
MSDLGDFLAEYDLSLLIALGQHLRLVAIALVAASAIAIPLGVFIWRNERAAGAVIGVASLIQTIPSIALFGLLIPILAMIDRGIGAVPATIALVLYAILPILRNTHAALRSIPPDAIDSARGIGMTERQMIRGVALPLAAPGVIAGIRTAATTSIGVAAIAAYIGAGGLGVFIARGIATSWNTMTIAGAIGVIILALGIELLLGWIERLLTPRAASDAERGSAG